MAEIYRARDTRLGRDVALEALPTEFSQSPERLHRFEQEARLAGSLNHPNVLTLFDVGTHDGAPYLVTELLEGHSLREVLEAGPLPTRKAIDHAQQIARGLAAAHAKGIVHRDLKPGNVFVTKDGRVKILDFGLAKLTQVDPGDLAGSQLSTDTAEGKLAGTVGYMAPEQLRGHAANSRAECSRCRQSKTFRPMEASSSSVLRKLQRRGRAFSEAPGAATHSLFRFGSPPLCLRATGFRHPSA